jgi:uncharacterized protein YgbK (DUF1537 family)
MLGIIADDFTGATDVAGYLTREGTRTMLYFGMPSAVEPEPDGADAVVIALKSRAAHPAAAVEESLSACDWLVERGTRHVYFKYCSTFDSNDRGNIGPVAEALAARCGQSATLVAPAAPENGRTVYQGNLFVGSQPLSESPMRDHPVNPMQDSNLVRLLQAQGCRRTGLLTWQTIRGGLEAITARVTEIMDGEDPWLVVADALDGSDLDALAAFAVTQTLSSGSAGLGAALGRALTGTPVVPKWPEFPLGGQLVLSGSCSVATRLQVAAYSAAHPSFKVDPTLGHPAEIAQQATAFVVRHLDKSPLVYSSADQAEVSTVQRQLGTRRAALLVEEIMGQTAVQAVAHGVGSIVVAGGETSGAVVSALGVTGAAVHKEICVGVPWTLPLRGPRVALALKSGNFGGPDFFSQAIAIASGGSDG